MEILAFASFALLVVAWVAAPTRTIVGTAHDAEPEAKAA
jgi:hypothetical protein